MSMKDAAAANGIRGTQINAQTVRDGAPRPFIPNGASIDIIQRRGRRRYLSPHTYLLRDKEEISGLSEFTAKSSGVNELLRFVATPKTRIF